MSQDEKLLLLEIIWKDLSKTEISDASWHEDALKETEERRALGLETAVDWKEAKKQLRSRFA